jgi:hypothetical protein
MKDLDYAHIYEPAIHLMSTYVAHAVAWLVQNGLPSLSCGHSGAVRLRREVRGGQCSHHPLDPDVDGLGVPGTERSAGIDGAIEGQNAGVACPRVVGWCLLH